LGCRISLDASSKNLSKKISEALRERIPYCMVIGEREAKLGTITFREYPRESHQELSWRDFFKKIADRSTSGI